MAIMKFRKYVRQTIEYDGKTLETALPLDTVMPSGTSGQIPLKSNGDSYFVYVSMMLQAGTEYTISENIGYEGTCNLYDAQGTKVASTSVDWDSYESIPITFTPDKTAVYVLYVSYYYSGSVTITFNTRPLAYTPPTLTPNQTSEGFDGFGVPVRYRCASEAGCDAGGIPTNGLYLWHQLDKSRTTLDTGQTTTTNGTVNFQTYKGVPCAKFNYSNIEFPDATLAYPCSMSIWYNCQSATNDFFLLSIFKPIGISFNYKKIGINRDLDKASFERDYDTWNNVVVVFETAARRKLYVNGELVSEYSSSNNATGNDGNENNNGVGGNDYHNSRWFDGYAAGLRVYSRALKDSEIKKLYEEYTPTN